MAAATAKPDSLRCTLRLLQAGQRTRERGEVRALRQEARRLRSESAVFEQQIEDLEKRVRLWSNATAVVAGSAAALLLTAMLFGGPSGDVESAPTAEVVEVQAEVPVTASIETAAPSAIPAAAPTPEASVGSVSTAQSTAVPTATTAPKAAAVPVEATPEPTGSVVHTVQKGETLGHIARQYYGKSSQWKRILDANRDVLPSASKLQPGMKLTVPSGD